MRAATVAIFATATVGASVGISGSTSPPPHPGVQHAPAAAGR
jgi:hypothetical protein